MRSPRLGPMAAIGLLGVPTNSAGRADGVARGPTALLEAGLLEALGRDGEVRDYGPVTLPDPSPERDSETHLIDPTGLATMVARVREAVAPILASGHFPLVIGGDCPVLLGCLAAARKEGSTGLLFVDGHEDAYPPARSTTGEAADMELAFALGMVDASWSPELAGILPLVAPADVRVLGARDAERIEAEGLRSIGDRLPVVDDGRLAADPAGETRAACAPLPDPWWFHLDLDVLSTEALPAVDYPQEGGLSWIELDAVTRAALAARPIGWDVTIYNPDLDPERSHARRIVRFLGTMVRAMSS